MLDLNYLHYNNKKHFVFIINPISGTNRRISFKELIQKEFKEYSFEIHITERPQHASEIASRYANQEDINVIGVGGDGTINEIAQALVNTNTRMGIIPNGSGNGFAGHLLKNSTRNEAIQILKNNRYALCDTLLINNNLCCNTSGIGLSAFVAYKFDTIGKRGLLSYVKLGLSTFYQFPTFNLTVDDIDYKDKLLLEITNSSQLGNKAFVSPDASVQDGNAELVFLKKPSVFEVPSLIYDVFSGSFKRNKLAYHDKKHSSKIYLEKENHLHIDGEYKGLVREVELKVLKQSLQFIC
ncbi:MAG: hypothetical protein HOP11_09280 [Saprospiraceae bacterium]|nr:hypothetical protein [Saprospiraceae bacterium]